MDDQEEILLQLIQEKFPDEVIESWEDLEKLIETIIDGLVEIENPCGEVWINKLSIIFELFSMKDVSQLNEIKSFYFDEIMDTLFTVTWSCKSLHHITNLFEKISFGLTNEFIEDFFERALISCTCSNCCYKELLLHFYNIIRTSDRPQNYLKYLIQGYVLVSRSSSNSIRPILQHYQLELPIYLTSYFLKLPRNAPQETKDAIFHFLVNIHHELLRDLRLQSFYEGNVILKDSRIGEFFLIIKPLLQQLFEDFSAKKYSECFFSRQHFQDGLAGNLLLPRSLVVEFLCSCYLSLNHSTSSIIIPHSKESIIELILWNIFCCSVGKTKTVKKFGAGDLNGNSTVPDPNLISILNLIIDNYEYYSSLETFIQNQSGDENKKNETFHFFLGNILFSLVLGKSIPENALQSELKYHFHVFDISIHSKLKDSLKLWFQTLTFQQRKDVLHFLSQDHKFIPLSNEERNYQKRRINLLILLINSIIDEEEEVEQQGIGTNIPPFNEYFELLFSIYLQCVASVEDSSTETIEDLERSMISILNCLYLSDSSTQTSRVSLVAKSPQHQLMILSISEKVMNYFEDHYYYSFYSQRIITNDQEDYHQTLKSIHSLFSKFISLRFPSIISSDPFSSAFQNLIKVKTKSLQLSLSWLSSFFYAPSQKFGDEKLEKLIILLEESMQLIKFDQCWNYLQLINKHQNIPDISHRFVSTLLHFQNSLKSSKFQLITNATAGSTMIPTTFSLVSLTSSLQATNNSSSSSQMDLLKFLQDSNESHPNILPSFLSMLVYNVHTLFQCSKPLLEWKQATNASKLVFYGTYSLLLQKEFVHSIHDYLFHSLLLKDEDDDQSQMNSEALEALDLIISMNSFTTSLYYFMNYDKRGSSSPITSFQKLFSLVQEKIDSKELLELDEKKEKERLNALNLATNNQSQSVDPLENPSFDEGSVRGSPVKFLNESSKSPFSSPERKNVISTNKLSHSSSFDQFPSPQALQQRQLQQSQEINSPNKINENNSNEFSVFLNSIGFPNISDSFNENPNNSLNKRIRWKKNYPFLIQPEIMSLSSSSLLLIALKQRIHNILQKRHSQQQTMKNSLSKISSSAYQMTLEVELLALPSILFQISSQYYRLLMNNDEVNHRITSIKNLFGLILSSLPKEYQITQKKLLEKVYSLPNNIDMNETKDDEDDYQEKERKAMKDHHIDNKLDQEEWELNGLLILQFYWDYYSKFLGSSRSEISSKVFIIPEGNNNSTMTIPHVNPFQKQNHLEFSSRSKLFSTTFVPLIEKNKSSFFSSSSSSYSSSSKYSGSNLFSMSHPDVQEQKQSLQNEINHSFTIPFMEKSFPILLATFLPIPSSPSHSSSTSFALSAFSENNGKGGRGSTRNEEINGLTEEDIQKHLSLQNFCLKFEIQEIEKLIRSEFLMIFLYFLQLLNDLSEQKQPQKDSSSSSSYQLFVLKSFILKQFTQFVDELLFGLCNTITILEVKLLMKILYNCLLLYQSFSSKFHELSTMNYSKIQQDDKEEKKILISIIFQLMFALQYLFNCQDATLITNMISLIFMISKEIKQYEMIYFFFYLLFFAKDEEEGGKQPPYTSSNHRKLSSKSSQSAQKSSLHQKKKSKSSWIDSDEEDEEENVPPLTTMNREDEEETDEETGFPEIFEEDDDDNGKSQDIYRDTQKRIQFCTSFFEKNRLYLEHSSPANNLPPRPKKKYNDDSDDDDDEDDEDEYLEQIEQQEQSTSFNLIIFMRKLFQSMVFRKISHAFSKASSESLTIPSPMNPSNGNASATAAGSINIKDLLFKEFLQFFKQSIEEENSFASSSSSSKEFRIKKEKETNTQENNTISSSFFSLLKLLKDFQFLYFERNLVIEQKHLLEMMTINHQESRDNTVHRHDQKKKSKTFTPIFTKEQEKIFFLLISFQMQSIFPAIAQELENFKEFINKTGYDSNAEEDEDEEEEEEEDGGKNSKKSKTIHPLYAAQLPIRLLQSSFPFLFHSLPTLLNQPHHHNSSSYNNYSSLLSSSDRRCCFSQENFLFSFFHQAKRCWFYLDRNYSDFFKNSSSPTKLTKYWKKIQSIEDSIQSIFRKHFIPFLRDRRSLMIHRESVDILTGYYDEQLSRLISMGIKKENEKNKKNKKNNKKNKMKKEKRNKKNKKRRLTMEDDDRKGGNKKRNSKKAEKKKKKSSLFIEDDEDYEDDSEDDEEGSEEDDEESEEEEEKEEEEVQLKKKSKKSILLKGFHEDLEEEEEEEDNQPRRSPSSSSMKKRKRSEEKKQKKNLDSDEEEQEDGNNGKDPDEVDEDDDEDEEEDDDLHSRKKRQLEYSHLVDDPSSKNGSKRRNINNVDNYEDQDNDDDDDDDDDEDYGNDRGKKSKPRNSPAKKSPKLSQLIQQVNNEMKKKNKKLLGYSTHSPHDRNVKKSSNVGLSQWLREEREKKDTYDDLADFIVF